MRRTIEWGVPANRAVLLLTCAFLAASSPIGSARLLAQTDTTFRHDRHADVECMECHGMDATHGASLIDDVSDCRSCHHKEERMEGDCADCHLVVDMKDVVHRVRRAFDLTVRDALSYRDLSFRHGDHEARSCAECHVGGPTLAVPDLDCLSCHEEHHAETASGCMGCHREPPEGAHTPAVHRTCSGSGCHQMSPILSPPRSRVGCLWCHQRQADHEPEGECVECHFMSAPMAAPGWAMTSPGVWIPIVDHGRG